MEPELESGCIAAVPVTGQGCGEGAAGTSSGEAGEQAAPEEGAPGCAEGWASREGQGCRGPWVGLLEKAFRDPFSHLLQTAHLPPPAPGFLRKGWRLDEAASLQFHGFFPLCRAEFPTSI